MLMIDLVHYIEAIVQPTIKDFEDHPTSVRHAFLACLVTFHCIDHLAFPNVRPATLRQQFRTQSPDFTVVDRVAHAVKHVAAGPRGNPSLRVGDVISRPPAFWGEMVWDLSRWDDAIGGVTLNEEREIDLLEAAKNTVKFFLEQGEQALRRSGPSAPQSHGVNTSGTNRNRTTDVRWV